MKRSLAFFIQTIIVCEVHRVRFRFPARNVACPADANGTASTVHLAGLMAAAPIRTHGRGFLIAAPWVGPSFPQ
jgi:hypothetical protein